MNHTHQPKVEILITQTVHGTHYEGAGFPHNIWYTLRDTFISPLRSTDHMVSNLRTIFIIFLSILLLLTLYKLLKRIINFLSTLWVQSEPNEWLLVIRNGNLVKAGVGLKTFITPWDSVVTYPSKVQRIAFLANNVTLEMQGVNINGVAFWSVHRQGDGPFKCYKYMQGGDANANVKTMCQSILRNLIANSKLDDVLKRRDLMKDNMKKQLQKPLKGWGIWLQSVQITQVQICSKKLFEELQAEFRNQTKIKAQKIQLQAQQKISQQKQKIELRLAQLRQQNQTKKDQQSLIQQLERIKQKAKYDQQNDKFDMQRLERNKKLELQRIKIEHQKQQEQVKNEQKVQRQRDAFEQQKVKRKIQLDSLYKGDALHKYSIDTMERIYQNLGIKDLRINQFVTGQHSQLGKLLPTLGLLNALPTNK